MIVIRHGDRWDYENGEVWKGHASNRKGDPSLSSLGHEQARDVGRYLDSFFSEKGIKSSDITWLSSPFLRCLQTSTEALSVMQELEGSTQIPIYPEDGVFEWDDANPPGSWHADLPPKEERIHYFPRLLNTASTYEPLYVPSIPEPIASFDGRCQKTLDALHQRHAYKPNTALVVVTHAACCVGFVAVASQRPKTEITPAAPCSIYQLSRSSDQTLAWTLDDHDAPQSKNGYTEHLHDLGSHTRPFNHFKLREPDAPHEGYTGPPDSRFAPDSLKQELS